MLTTRLHVGINLEYQIPEPGADFIFNVHAASTAYQKIEKESFRLNQNLKTDLFTSSNAGSRFVRLRANPGLLTVAYEATVSVNHHLCAHDKITEIDIANLPTSVLGFIYPSRYCQSDRLSRFAIRNFGSLHKGYSRVIAIQNWVRNHVTFLPNTTNSSTSALDTLVEGAGVCRDFAHLMIALCRALSIPARMATGTDYGADPALGPPDLHAYVEVFLGNRWYMFDPSGTTIPTGLIRIGTGRDAADVAFATIFGAVQSHPLKVSTKAINGDTTGATIPQHTKMAISTAEA